MISDGQVAEPAVALLAPDHPADAITGDFTAWCNVCR